MTNAHILIIAGLVVGLFVYLTSDMQNDMATFQRKISKQTDYQAYDDKPLLPESAFKEVGNGNNN